ncbi:MAG: DUF4391 domain-containing protein [Clostridiaceae bacterium]|nr:DUF4391 domain-containing protein [Clostridiaceae bacterium]
MLNIPEKYKVEKSFAIKTFIPKELKPADKNKLKQSLKSVKLEYQIAGEGIPSVINEDYNCQVIAFFSVELEDIKHASFVANILQEMIKPLAVVRLYDHVHEAYSLAIKRLSKQDEKEIVIEEIVLIPKMSKIMPDKTKMMLNQQLDFVNIINKDNKLNYYKELLIKSYMVANENTVSFIKDIYDSKIWYNSNKAMDVFRGLKKINLIKFEMKKSTSNTEKTKLISRQKEIIEDMKNIITEV